MRNILSGARGMSPVVLVILIAWALLSVIFLTGTLLAARSIDRSVSGVTNRTDRETGKPEKNISDTVEEIGSESKFIDEARKTVQISTAIRKAADPLSARLATTLRVADKGIDPRLKSILGKVGDINETAGSINTTAKGIGTTVDSIGSSVGTIGGAVQTINDSVKSIGRRGVSIRSSASEINGSARSILGRLSSVLSLVQTIDGKVETINGQAQSILKVAGTNSPSIQTDFVGINRNVGVGGHEATVVGHANGIDCSTLLLNLIPTNRSAQCNK